MYLKLIDHVSLKKIKIPYIWCIKKRFYFSLEITSWILFQTRLSGGGGGGYKLFRWRKNRWRVDSVSLMIIKKIKSGIVMERVCQRTPPPLLTAGLGAQIKPEEPVRKAPPFFLRTSKNCSWSYAKIGNRFPHTEGWWTDKCGKRRRGYAGFSPTSLGRLIWGRGERLGF